MTNKTPAMIPFLALPPRRASISITVEKDGLILITVRRADVDIRHLDGSSALYHEASMDIYLCGIDPKISTNVWAMGELADEPAPDGIPF
jgi:hypothetical protein